MNVGDTIKSYDFHFNKDCYAVGTVTDIQDEVIFFDCAYQMWNGEIETKGFDPKMKTLVQGALMLDEKFERVLVLT